MKKGATSIARVYARGLLLRTPQLSLGDIAKIVGLSRQRIAEISDLENLTDQRREARKVEREELIHKLREELWGGSDMLKAATK